MADHPQTLRDRAAPPGGDGALRGAIAYPVSWRVAAATVALSLAAVSAPIAVALVAASDVLPWRPLAAGALVALLVLAPAGVGLLTALAGLQRIAALAAQSAGEAEHAVLRVIIVTLLFGHALAWAAMGSAGISAGDCMAVAAPGLVAAWTLLLCVILWPVAPALRRFAGVALDILLLSAFLHFGDGAMAGWYPLYLLAIFYAGWRFGPAALAGAATAGVVGFAAVVWSTDPWRQQPALAAGLLVALAVLPALVAATLRGLTGARAAAAASEAERQRTLALIAETLRGPSAAAYPAPTPASPIADILDFAALEAGVFAAPVESFDLRTLVRSTLEPLRTRAAGNGLALRWRIDPRLPHRLRGTAQAFARVLSGLADYAAEVAQGRAVRIAIGGAADARRLTLRIQVDGLAAGRDPGIVAGEVPLALRLVERVAELADGTFAIEELPGKRVRLWATLPLTIEEGAVRPALDLGRCPVLIATDDDELAAALAEPLAVWNADPIWPGDADAVLAELERDGAGQRPLVIVDGRHKLLAALILAHQAAQVGRDAPFILLIAEEAQLAGLGDVDEGEFDGLIPTPVSEELLGSALYYTLPLVTDRPARLDLAPRQAPPLQEAAVPPVSGSVGEARVTPIAAHPKFAGEGAPAVDVRVIDGLRAIGGNPGFLRDVIDAFRTDAHEIMQRVGEAAAAADPARFARGLVALHRAAGHLGGTQLCALAASLQRQTVGELRQHGALHVKRLDAEIDRLAEALAEYLPEAEAGWR